MKRFVVATALLLALPACQGNEPPSPTHAAAVPTLPAAAVAGAPARTAAQVAKQTPTEYMAGGWNVAHRCAACHHFDSTNSIGPGLAGIFNRKAGSMPGYNYRFTTYIAPGKAWRWDTAHLKAWVCDSGKAVREFTGNDAAETAMPAQELCDPDVQAELIAYLKTL